MRWNKRENDWKVAWGTNFGRGRLKGPACGLMNLVIGGGREQDEKAFRDELRRMGFDHTTVCVTVDVLKD